jgi:ABC-type transport system involved in multi-copper enzyme maturation permease subunit
MMSLEVLRFELEYSFKRPLLYIFAATFFFMAFLIVSSDAVMPIGLGGNVARNAPFVIFNVLLFLNMFGLTAVAFFVAPAVNRDHEWNTQELFFTTPVKKWAYLLGRFLGATFPVALAMMMSCVGIALAAIMPWQDPEYFVAFNIRPYLYSLVLFIIPNLYLAGAIFFSIATLTRKTFMAYVAVVIFIVLYGLSRAFLGDLDNQAVVSMADPFGWSSFRVMTQYWTVAERNTQLLPFSGILLLNRILWLFIATGILFYTVFKYRLKTGEASGRGRRRVQIAIERETDTGEGAAASAAAEAPEAILDFSPRGRFAQLLSHTVFETKSVLRSMPFLVVMLFGAANLIARLFLTRRGSSPWPLTQEMLDRIQSGFWIYPMLVIAIYSADLIWKDRRTRINEITDALPVPNWIPLVSRFAALYVISALMLVFAMVCTICFQTAKGHFDFELVLYFKALFLVALSEWMLFAALAIFCQVLGGSLPLGTLLFVLYLLVQEVPGDLGYEHHMITYPNAPEVTYSDMNGYGHFAAPVFWYRLYWGFFAAGLLVLANWLWVRGTDNRISQRLRKFRQRITRRSVAALAVSSLGFVLVGGWILYNTTVLNPYHTEQSIENLQALYEKRYKQYDGLPQPKVTAARLEVDIYPESRTVDLRGRLRLVNKTNVEIEKIHVFSDPTLTINSYDLPVHAIDVDDTEIGYRIYSLEAPLAPGDSLDFGIDVSSVNRGFMNDHSNVQVVGNGTFIENSDYIPQIGYSPGFEIEEPDKRKKHDLPDLPRIAAVDDTNALQRIFTPDADRIDFEAVVSTSPDQIALAPGYLQREWEE